jgi:hypothetical protein
MKNYQIQPVTGREIISGNMFYRRTQMDLPVSARPQLIFDVPAGRVPADRPSEKDKLMLERHFNDLYAVFLHKLTAFALQPNVTEEETARLRAFFDELLKARRALEEQE